MGSSRELKYITVNRGVLYYTRSIPKDVQHLDPRSNPIQKSLQTKNHDIAMSRRDMHADADDRYWRLLRITNSPNQSRKELETAGDDIMDLIGTERVPFDLTSFPKGKVGLSLLALYQQQAEQIFSRPSEGMFLKFDDWLKQLPFQIADSYRTAIRNTQLTASIAKNFEDPSKSRRKFCQH